MSETSEILNNVLNYSASNSSSSATKEKKMKPSEKMLAKIAKMGFNMSQLDPILKTKGNQLTISCAGSGKTTTMVFKIIYDMTTGYATRLVDINGTKVRVPEKIKVCTFLKSGADELEASLTNWNRLLGCADTARALSFSTLHAEFKRTLEAMGKSVNIISGADNTKLLKGVLKSYSLRNANNMPLTSQDINDIESALAYTRNRLDEERYTKDIYDDCGMGATIVDCILRDWKEARQKAGKMDFEDLQEMLYDECYRKNNEEVISFIQDRYTFIYIDEFQDTSQIQYELIKVYGAKAKQVLAIGDDDQTIYSWRGSCNDIIVNRFSEDFNPIQNALSVNFRCPSNILNSIKPSIELNQKRFNKELQSYNQGGEVFYGSFLNYSKLLEFLGDQIYEDVKNGMDVAVLCRVNSDGLMPALILDRVNSFNFSISGDGMTLDSYVGRGAIGICKLFTERASSAVKTALNFLTWDNYAVNSLLKVCKENKRSIWDISKEDLSYSCPDFAERIFAWRSWVAQFGEIKALKLVLADYRTKVFYKDTQFNSVMRSAIQSIESLLDYFDYETVEDFIEELEDINDRLKARKGLRGVNVRIATVHEFKGKESDSVYVWNDSDYVFPHKNCNIANEDELEEERRVHYIACTRAKKKLTLLSIKNKEGMFLQEMDLSNATPINAGGIHGTLKKEVIDGLESDAGLRHFEDSCTEVFSDDNEFWGQDANDPLSH